MYTGNWIIERDVYGCLKCDDSQMPEMSFCETEWDKLDSTSKEYVTSSENNLFAIRFNFDHNLLNNRRFRKRVDKLRNTAHVYLKWKEERNDS